MRLLHTTSALRAARAAAPRVVAIGVFDGLHLGHQAILAATLELAEELSATGTVLTFEPMPREYFEPANPPSRLTRFRERFELFRALGVGELCCLRFASVRPLSAQQFIDGLLVDGLRATGVVVGDDFRFGMDRTGDVGHLEEAGRRHGFVVEHVPPVLVDGERVSSTAIRERLGRGDLAAARAMLGRDYAISGRVVRGLGLGRDFGYPTANVNLKRRLTPVDGIFAVRVGGLGDGFVEGVASVGTRPTVGGTEPLLEVHLFDFDRNIYGRQITVHFIERLRAEEHFPDVEALKAQMHRDCDAARAALVA